MLLSQIGPDSVVGSLLRGVDKWNRVAYFVEVILMALKTLILMEKSRFLSALITGSPDVAPHGQMIWGLALVTVSG